MYRKETNKQTKSLQVNKGDGLREEEGNKGCVERKCRDCQASQGPLLPWAGLTESLVQVTLKRMHQQALISLNPVVFGIFLWHPPMAVGFIKSVLPLSAVLTRLQKASKMSSSAGQA